jgi:hypothetical protein
MDDRVYERNKIVDCLEEMDLHVAKARAWKQFFAPSTVDHLVEGGCSIEAPRFHYGSCDATIRFDGTEKDFRKLIDGLRQTGSCGYNFKRRDIYDKNAYSTLPLSYFVGTAVDCKIDFGIPIPMMFAPTSFVLKHQLVKWGNRWGRLYCNDGRLENYAKERQVAENRNFRKEATRQEMFLELLEMVKKRGDECLFTISGDEMIGSMIKAQSEAGRLAAQHQQGSLVLG